MAQSLEKDREKFLQLKEIAVVGASNDRQKYGNIVFRKLKDKGYKVYAVNPNADMVEGDKCYHQFCDLPANVEGAVFVVPPSITEKVVKEACASGLKFFWMQPGAEKREAVDFCSENGATCISNNCILVALR